MTCRGVCNGDPDTGGCTCAPSWLRTGVDAPDWSYADGFRLVEGYGGSDWLFLDPDGGPVLVAATSPRYLIDAAHIASNRTGFPHPLRLLVLMDNLRDDGHAHR
jgi:hypothetical protein